MSEPNTSEPLPIKENEDRGDMGCVCAYIRHGHGVSILSLSPTCKLGFQLRIVFM